MHYRAAYAGGKNYSRYRVNKTKHRSKFMKTLCDSERLFKVIQGQDKKQEERFIRKQRIHFNMRHFAIFGGFTNENIQGRWFLCNSELFVSDITFDTIHLIDYLFC